MSEPQLTIEERAAAAADLIEITAENYAKELSAAYSPEHQPIIETGFIVGYCRRATEALGIGPKEKLSAEIIELLAEINGNWDNHFKRHTLYKTLEKLSFELAKLTLGLR